MLVVPLIGKKYILPLAARAPGLHFGPAPPMPAIVDVMFVFGSMMSRTVQALDFR
jgi:hypothetical protein